MSRLILSQRLGAIPAVAEAGVPRNTVIHGDCIEVMAGFPAACVDFILTDPPYICRYRDRNGRTVANDDNARWLKPAFAQAYRVLKPDSLCVSFYGWQQADQFIGAWRESGFRLVGHLVFAKDYASSTRFVAARHECAYILAKGEPALPAKVLPDVLQFPYTGNRFHLRKSRWSLWGNWLTRSAPLVAWFWTRFADQALRWLLHRAVVGIGWGSSLSPNKSLRRRVASSRLTA